MAHIFNCATDWTYDRFLNDMKAYEAPEGKWDPHTDDTDYNKYFITWLKATARDFTEAWKAEHDGHLYVRGAGYVGDAFKNELYRGEFSDFYKDTYGQRPHLPVWYYIHPLGLPMQEDTARTFCAEPVRDAARMAQQAREAWA